MSILYINYDAVKQEMLKRGATQTQVESKAVAIALDVIENADGLYTEIATLKRTLNDLKRNIAAEQSAHECWDRQRDRRHKERIKEAEKYLSYMREFDAKLHERETPEARDRLKAAQMFVNSVDVNTKYDNTAYIIGLASIISGEKISAVNELKKINPKLFDGWNNDAIEI